MRFDPFQRVAVASVVAAAGASVAVACDGLDVVFDLDGAAVAALLEAGSGTGVGASGVWADVAVGGFVERLGDVRDDDLVALYGCLADAAGVFDAVAAAALDGPVRFSGGDPLVAWLPA